MATKIASLYAEIGVKTDQLDKGLKDAKKSLGSATSGIGELIKGAGVAAGVLGAFGFAAKKAFDLASEGAQLRQTYISFQQLMGQIGAAPDLLNQLKMAARGTVDEISLMSSTTMLLAGTQGDLAKSMAESAPQLLKIADAANMLNPTLGDTTFFFNSLATGIKRGSPLLIDNLGITLSIEEAYRTYASTLGKTTDALTKDEKSQALLNEVLRKGQTVIKQAGDGTASLTDDYEAFNVSIKDNMNALKMWLDKALRPTVVGVTKLLQVNEALFSAMDDGKVSYTDAMIISNRYRLGLIDQEEALSELTAAEKRHEEQSKKVNIVVANSDVAAKAYSHQLPIVAGKIVELKHDTIELVSAQKIELDALEKQSAALKNQSVIVKEVKDIYGQFEDAMARSLTVNKTEALRLEYERMGKAMEELQGFMNGRLGPELDDFNDRQADLRDRMGEVQKKIEKPNEKSYLTDDQKEQLDGLHGDLDELKTQYDENADEHEKATKRIILDLLMQKAAVDGVTEEEGAMIEALAQKWGLIDLATVKATAAVEKSLQDLAAGKGFEDTQAQLELTLAYIDKIHLSFLKLDGMTSTMYVNVQQTQVGTFASGGVPTTGGPKQHGGIVLPGMRYTVGEAGPETLVMGQSGGYVIPNSGGDQRPINITINGDVTRENIYTLARAVGAELNRQSRYN